jgi:Spy/CpxP family protein refolding chaperone
MLSLRRVSVLGVLMLSLGSAVAFANPNSLLPQAIAQNTEEQSRPNRGKAQLFQELNLTPEQTQQIEAIQNQYQDQISQRRQAVRQARQELVELMASTASQNQIREKYRQVETLKQQVADIKFESMLAMREVLTPEQRRQFAERKQNRWGNYRNRERREQGEQG